MNNSPGLRLSGSNGIGKGAIEEYYSENHYGIFSAVLGNPIFPKEEGWEPIQITGNGSMIESIPPLVSPDYYEQGKLTKAIREDMETVHYLACIGDLDYLKKFAILAHQILNLNKEINHIGMGTTLYTDEGGDIQIPTIVTLGTSNQPWEIRVIPHSFDEMDRILESENSLFTQFENGESVQYPRTLLERWSGKTSKKDIPISDDKKNLSLENLNTRLESFTSSASESFDENTTNEQRALNTDLVRGTKHFTLVQRYRQKESIIRITKIQDCVKYGINLALR